MVHCLNHLPTLMGVARDGVGRALRADIASASKSSIRRFVITEKAPTRALTPRSLNVKLGPQRNYHEGRAAIRHYANQPAVPYDLCIADQISR